MQPNNNLIPLTQHVDAAKAYFFALLGLDPSTWVLTTDRAFLAAARRLMRQPGGSGEVASKK